MFLWKSDYADLLVCILLSPCPHPYPLVPTPIGPPCLALQPAGRASGILYGKRVFYDLLNVLVFLSLGVS